MKPMLAVLLSASLLTAGAAYAKDVSVSGVDVEVDFSDARDATARSYWPRIEEDLETAILDAVRPILDTGGYQIDVRLNEVSLNGALDGEAGPNRMEGWVFIREPGDDVPVKSVRLTLDASTDAVPAIPATVIEPGTDDFYEALLDAFARRTLAEVQDI